MLNNIGIKNHLDRGHIQKLLVIGLSGSMMTGLVTSCWALEMYCPHQIQRP